jgi:hypothetical protein
MSADALRRLEARGGWDETDLNDFATIGSRVQRLEDALQTIRNRYSEETVAGRVARAALDESGMRNTDDA